MPHTPKPLKQLQLFNFWKWRALAKRRTSLYPLICINCMSMWGAARYVTEEIMYQHIDHYTGSAGDTTTNYNWGRALPNVFYTVHIISVLLFIYESQFGQNMINDFQGKRVVLINTLSLHGCVLYCVINNRLGATSNLLSDYERGCIIGFAQVLCLLTTHHCGLSQNFAWLNFIISSVIDFVWLFIISETRWAGVAVVVGLIVIFICITCEDFELRLAYVKLKVEAEEAHVLEEVYAQASEGTANPLEHPHPGERTFSPTQPQTPGTRTPEANFRLNDEDIGHVLRLVDRSHAVINDGLFPQISESSTLNTMIARPETAHLMHTRLLTQTLIAASLPQRALAPASDPPFSPGEKNTANNQGALSPQQIYLSHLCAKTFNLLEAVADSALPLYTAVDSPDFLMMTNIDVYEMMLYLLVADAVLGAQSSNVGVCSVKLKYHESKWQVNLQIALALAPQPLQGFEVEELLLSGGPYGYNGFLGDLDEDDELENQPETSWILQGVGRLLSADPQQRNARQPPLTRLAAKISLTQACVRLNTDPPEVIEGIIFHRRSFNVPGQPGNGVVDQRLSVAMDNKQEWVLVEQHPSDEAALIDLKRKLELLQVPVRICKGVSSYKQWTQLHNVVVISESALETLTAEQMQFRKLLRPSDVRVVLTSPTTRQDKGQELADDDTLDNIELKYQLKDTHALPRLASLHRVHQSVQRVMNSQRPRRLVASKGLTGVGPPGT